MAPRGQLLLTCGITFSPLDSFSNSILSSSLADGRLLPHTVGKSLSLNSPFLSLGRRLLIFYKLWRFCYEGAAANAPTKIGVQLIQQLGFVRRMEGEFVVYFSSLPTLYQL
ncbi:hypothetical protein Ccrd_008218 [Cynara cardunculus var. scolymus]|uniref:Uncharacterized protein n=1 Tax=Cynara cardunculus var. scolymus TaxID=59895 RepID=A0A103XFJ2_CYNCS|nr:hypothetical protein Ccrd_008218 [Cynara cardunculus var. scolymus]